jgi:protein TonB
MAHAVSASFLRSEHMSPPAVALAVLLHALVILGLWGASHLRPPPSQFEDVIEVSIEQPKPPEPPPPPPEQKPQPPLPPVVRMGLSPPSPNISDKPTQAPQAEPKTGPPAPAPPPFVEATRPSVPQPPPPTPPEPKPQPTSPKALAAVAPPTPPALPHTNPLPPLPPHPQPQRPEIKPSPLTMAPQRRPPAASSAEPPSPHPFVNPADSYSRARVADNYLWQVVSKLIGYHYQAHVNVSQGTTVVRVVIARDGRLLDVTVIRSSGVPEFDRGVIAGVRNGSPYAPLPDDIKGASASFDLPLVSVSRQQ